MSVGVQDVAVSTAYMQNMKLEGDAAKNNSSNSPKGTNGKKIEVNTIEQGMCVCCMILVDFCV